MSERFVLILCDLFDKVYESKQKTKKGGTESDKNRTNMATVQRVCLREDVLFFVVTQPRTQPRCGDQEQDYRTTTRGKYE